MFEYMGDRLSNAIRNIKGMGKITEENIGDAIREIRTALLEADVNYEVVKEFTKNVKEKALGMEVSKSLKPEELFIKIVKDELVSLLGGDYVPLEVNKNPTVIISPIKKAPEAINQYCHIYIPPKMQPIIPLNNKWYYGGHIYGKRTINT